MIIGDAYEGKWASRFIINGKLYYIDTAGGMIFAPTTGTATKYHCVDLHTGEELWVKTFLNNQTIAFGQLLNWQTLNSHGTFAYLWVQVGGGFSPIPATWYAFDAFTGDWRFTIQNVPRGTTMVDDSGAIYILQTDLINSRIALWNMTKLCTTGSAGFQSASWGNSVNGKTFNAGGATPAATAAWEWNETIPTGLPGGVVTTFFGDRIIGSDLGSNIQGSGATPTTTIWGLSLKQGQEGTLLFNATWMTPIDWIEGNKSLSWRAHSAEDKVGVIWSAESREHYGVSYETGQLIWGPNSPQNYLDAYSPMANRAVAYGKLYVTGVSGTVYCYNITTGERLWIYHANDKYSEVLWANNWWLGVMFVTDGKIYLGHLEHSPIQPLPRGAPFICLNTTNGDEIWLADGMFRQTFWGGRAIIGDSIIATQDTYDQRVYAIGKGPSKTSVTASPKVSVHGSSVMIEGMITDVSPGTNDPAIAMRFPNGVPAVSDDSMSDWMLCVYKQFERPTNAIGVQVTIETYDPNGNYQNLGTVFTDANGEYGLAFVPEVPGTYWISATFEGSNGYYSSTSSTYITVDESPDVGPTVTVTEYPGYQGPSASEVAQNVVNNLPDNPTSAEIAQAVENQLDIPEPAEIPEYPEYTTMDIIIIILVVIAIVIGVVSLLRKRE